jgi:hypothetical protein
MGASGSLMAMSSFTQGAASFGSAYSQAGAMKAQGDYQAKMAELNSEFAELQAADALKRGDRNASSVIKEGDKVAGAQRASLAGQGVDVNFGSARTVQDDTRHSAALDALTVKNNAWREAWGYKMQALESSSRGEFAGFAAQNQANNTLLTGGMQAFGSGLKGYAYLNGRG